MPRTVATLTGLLEENSRWAAEFMGAVSLREKGALLDELVDTLRAAAVVYRTSGFTIGLHQSMTVT